LPGKNEWRKREKGFREANYAVIPGKNKREKKSFFFERKKGECIITLA
jgi:hypothetical protein